MFNKIKDFLKKFKPNKGKGGIFTSFKAEVSHVFKSKWKLIAWILMLFIPATYGFFYSNAYWKPFKETEQLKVGIVNLNKTKPIIMDSAKNFEKEIIEETKIGVGTGKDRLKLDIKNIDVNDLYNPEKDSQEKALEAAQRKVADHEYDALIVIDEKYNETQSLIHSLAIENILKVLVSNIVKPDETKVGVTDILNIYNSIMRSEDLKGRNLVHYYSSYKHNYVIGKMTSMIGTMNKFGRTALIPDKNSLIAEIKNSENSIIEFINKATGIPSETIKDAINTLLSDTKMNSFLEAFKNINDKIIQNSIANKTFSPAPNVDTYGKGLSPYFVAIAIWAGGIILLFLFTNKRRTKTVSTIKNYFGKSIAWLVTGWIQSILLSSVILLQGYIVEENGIELYAMNLFLSTIFILCVQAIGYAFRKADLGKVAAILVLVMQLVTSSGTFPVETENGFFRAFAPILPFTYAIEALRELSWHPSVSIIFKDIGILIIFPIIFIGISLAVNLFFDNRTKTKNGYIDYERFTGDI